MMGLFSNRIFHMASMARSGETLLLRILSVHPKIRIVHNLEESDNNTSEKAFQFFKNYNRNKIVRHHKIVKPYNLNRKEILLIKQGVWKHPHQFKGFVLSRNPLSIYASLKTYDKDEEWYTSSNFWKNNEARLLRWSENMDNDLKSSLLDKTPTEQFVLFYNKRMGDLINLGLPIFTYEDLVLNPDKTIRGICDSIELGMTSELLNSHTFYKKGKIGHGKNDLSRPIDLRSLDKYKNILSNKEVEYISRNTKDIHEAYGYRIKNNEIQFQK